MGALAAMAVAGLLGLSGSAAAEDMKMDMPMGAPKPAAVDDAYGKALSASMSRMMSGMDVASTGRPDDDFARMMVPHHQGAIDMARIELQYGKDPVLRKLARAIVAAQEKEIADMRAWQAKRGKP